MAICAGFDADELRESGAGDVDGLLRLDQLRARGGQFRFGARRVGAGPQLRVHQRADGSEQTVRRGPRRPARRGRSPARRPA